VAAKTIKETMDKKFGSYWHHSDMNEEMRAEAIEMSITACEKYAPNYEMDDAPKTEGEGDKKIIHVYPLVK
uniref:CSON003836 protein n=1 Tax=Culicoides sonorensis TaxID=179676 RepID=A0A336L638_CULSO